jgi:hypothetical protein
MVIIIIIIYDLSMFMSSEKIVCLFNAGIYCPFYL